MTVTRIEAYMSVNALWVATRVSAARRSLPHEGRLAAREAPGEPGKVLVVTRWKAPPRSPASAGSVCPTPNWPDHSRDRQDLAAPRASLTLLRLAQDRAGQGRRGRRQSQRARSPTEASNKKLGSSSLRCADR
jgi:hypothetical protein